MTTRKALGRGLSALIPTTAVMTQELPAGEKVNEIPVKMVARGKDQPRIKFDPVRLEELIQSIKEKGVIQPIVVRPLADATYELIAGERRLRAAIGAGLERIPAIVREVSDEDALELALIENLQREELNVIETADAYKKLIDRYQLTQEEVAVKVGKDRATVANALRLLSLPDELKGYIQEGALSMGHARTLLSLPSKPAQRKAAMLMMQKGLSVREAELLVKRMVNPAPRVREQVRDPQYTRLEESLERSLGCRVACQPYRKGGKIEITYHSQDDLSRILDILDIDIS